jgi:hypothetical protein
VLLDPKIGSRLPTYLILYFQFTVSAPTQLATPTLGDEVPRIVGIATDWCQQADAKDFWSIRKWAGLCNSNHFSVKAPQFRLFDVNQLDSIL